MPLLFALLTWLNILVFVCLVSAHGHGILGITGTELKSADLATIALLAATLVVIGVGVAVALVTFVGYREIRTSAIRAASAAAIQEATRVATDVAQSVATRTARETAPAETTDQEAQEIAQADNGPAGQH